MINNTKQVSIYALTLEELNKFLDTKDFSQFLAPFFYQYLYKNKINQAFSQAFLTILHETFDFNLPMISKISSSEDGTIKFLMTLKDNSQIETVLIPFHKKYTICLSSQVGCAMNCSFCYTGKMGLKRHLKAEEIIGQYLVALNYLQDLKNTKVITPNVVFMGQGEPLHNADEVLKSIQIMLEPKGLGLGPRQMTLSTAGYMPGLKKLINFPSINIALSLHSPFNQMRSELIPINEHYPLEDIFIQLDKLNLKKRQFITYEYLLIKDFNDREADAIELAKWLNPRKAIVNIIAFNPFPGSHYKRPEPIEVENFKQKLVRLNLRTMIRVTKGSEVLAACGQLNTREEITGSHIQK